MTKFAAQVVGSIALALLAGATYLTSRATGRSRRPRLSALEVDTLVTGFDVEGWNADAPSTDPTSAARASR